MSQSCDQQYACPLMSYKLKEQIRHLQEEPNTQKWKHFTRQIQLAHATVQIIYSNQYMDSYKCLQDIRIHVFHQNIRPGGVV
jgi:hypothetical protein